MEELNVSDKNMPDILPKNVKTSSFGGRIRVSALIAADADKWIGKVISVGGWVKTIRLQGGGEFSFIEINDGSNIKGIQVVVNKTLSNFSEIVKEGIGSCFQIRGLVVKSLGSKQPVRNMKIYLIFIDRTSSQ
jgi:asparaginyl-tRNA synthetase